MVEPDDLSVDRLRELMAAATAHPNYAYTHTGDNKVYALMEEEQEDGTFFAAGADTQSLRESSGLAGGTAFTGGLYAQDIYLKQTCGGNSFGAPCLWDPVSLIQGAADPDQDYSEIFCSYYSNTGDRHETARPWCYTESDLTRWGYCDCSDYEWSRPSLVGFGAMNVGAARGGDVFHISDDLHHPVNRVGVTEQARARLGVDGSLCVSAERYMPFVEKLHHNYEWEVMCGTREALTGIAGTGRMWSTSGAWSPAMESYSPRCGVPAGWSIDTSASTFLTTGTSSWYSREKYDGCGDYAVAVGLKFPANEGGRPRLICAPYTLHDSANFSRVCTNSVCSGLIGTTRVASAAACTTLCANTQDCAAVSYSGSTAISCSLYSESCDETEMPYGRAVVNHTYHEPAVFTPVRRTQPNRLATFH